MVRRGKFREKVCPPYILPNYKHDKLLEITRLCSNYKACFNCKEISNLLAPSIYWKWVLLNICRGARHEDVPIWPNVLVTYTQHTDLGYIGMYVSLHL